MATSFLIQYETKQTFGVVYNFWEPLHYIFKGYGFQTWEVSPAYSIRSWAYIFLHYPFIAIGQFLSDGKVSNALLPMNQKLIASSSVLYSSPFVPPSG
jgi:hypothetical protein